MSPKSAIAQLKDELDQFVALLEEEAGILGSNQADALVPLVFRRDAANRRLASLWQQLSSALALPADAGFNTVRERCTGLPLWQETEAQVHRAEQLNRLNSKLIDEQLRRTQAAAQVLRAAAGGRTLYGADGRMSDSLIQNRSIDTA